MHLLLGFAVNWWEQSSLPVPTRRCFRTVATRGNFCFKILTRYSFVCQLSLLLKQVVMTTMLAVSGLVVRTCPRILLSFLSFGPFYFQMNRIQNLMSSRENVWKLSITDWLSAFPCSPDSEYRHNIENKSPHRSLFPVLKRVPFLLFYNTFKAYLLF